MTSSSNQMGRKAKEIVSSASEYGMRSSAEIGIAACVAAAIRQSEDYDALNGEDKLGAFVRDSFDNSVSGQYPMSSHGFLSMVDKFVHSGLSNNELINLALHNDFSLFDHEAYSDPTDVRHLALAVMNPKATDSISDLCCGDGALLVDIASEMSPAHLDGVEIRKDVAAFASARLDLLDRPNSVRNENCFSNPQLGIYDKVYLSCPFGMRFATMGDDGTYLEPLRKGNGPFGRPSSADWAFAKLAFDSLTNDGLAIVVMANGATFNKGDEVTRRRFVQDGMVRAVISLPRGLYSATAVPCSMLLLGRNDGNIRMVDATDLVKLGRRQNSLASGGIDEILRRLHQDSERSRFVERKEIAKNGYSLFAGRYLQKLPKLENATPLEDVSISIERGSNLSAQRLDELATTEDTGIRYIRVQDITDGAISEEAPAIKLDENSITKAKAHLIRRGDVVISKSMQPFKVAVADISDDMTLLACGNLYVIHPIIDKIDPYFLAAFLTSDDGAQSLQSCMVGTSILNLPVNNLRRMEVPLPPMEKQHRVAELYRSGIDEVQVLRIRIDKARYTYSSAYREVMGL
ncbi:MAG: hypothetical protein DUD35_13965 [Lactobacillus sp.]|nr:MAG: hypothetical protein DUD35_13965 [Lactobacillus sp.]